MFRIIIFLMVALPGWAQAQAHNIAIPSWIPRHSYTITHAISVTTRGPTPQGVRQQTISGILYRPAREGRMPGAVIVNSSGGVDGDSELVWAAYLAELGIATLVLDSFEPRGIRSTSRDQSLLDQFWSSQDGAAGWRWLAEQDFVARDNILIMGLSRGASAAIANAVSKQRIQMRSEDARFAAHVAISPGCGVQQRTAATTGAPIFFMLGELDDYTPIQPCLEYSDRMRAAGNPNIRRAIYAGGFHGPELHGGSVVLADVETWNRCQIFREDDARNFTDVASGNSVSSSDVFNWARKHCLNLGGSVGGDMRLRQQMGADLLRFLMQYGFVRDNEMLATLPACNSLPETGGYRRSCQRAAWGWPAEAARLGWQLRRGSASLPNDPARSMALTRLAANRNEVDAQLYLAIWLRNGSNGAVRDLATARLWATRADEQGSSGGAYELGHLAETDRDLPTARQHFQRAAERYNPFGMAEFGRFLAGGLGGPAEPVAAERWLHLAVHYENAWGHIYLAQAIEAGQLARPADRAAALMEFRKAAAIDFNGREDARRQVARLEAAQQSTR